MKKTQIGKSVGVFLFQTLVIFILVTGLIAGCGGGKTIKKEKQQLSPGEKIQASLDRLYNAIQLNPDGTLSFDERGTGFQALTETDKAFGNALLASCNQRVKAGMLKVNADYSVQWQDDAALKKSLKGGSCKTHWWGEECSVNSSTTKKICKGLKSGEGALLICDLIPVVDTACEIIEFVGAIPLEAEICPCASRGKGSKFNVTWVGVCWFKCD